MSQQIDRPNEELFGSTTNPLLILELANNHNGSVAHGKRIIESAKSALDGFFFRAAIKFQYRDLDSFIHPKFKGDHSHKYVQRFEETRLTEDEFLELIEFSRELGFEVACTPFDEESVKKVIQHGFDYLKVASASSTDWPLLTEVAHANLPTVMSTGGLGIREMDRSVVFLSKRLENLALMHCVGLYPTPDSELALNRIDFMKRRYQGLPVGYSTHERPDNYQAVGLALAKGAQVFEKHIAEHHAGKAPNSYSSTSKDLREWATSLKAAVDMTSGMDGDAWINSNEQSSLEPLKRGVFAREDLSEGDQVADSSVFFAIPKYDGQLSANNWSGFETKTVIEPVGAGSPVLSKMVDVTRKDDRLRNIIEEARGLLDTARVLLPPKSRVELSHHYGLDKFYQFGALLITVVNREYCKKIIVVFPGQSNPPHLHKEKEETFVCLSGELTVILGGKASQLVPGDVLTVSKGTEHSFSSQTGAVFEEISSFHSAEDSFYVDEEINLNPNRKTELSVWALKG